MHCIFCAYNSNTDTHCRLRQNRLQSRVQDVGASKLRVSSFGLLLFLPYGFEVGLLCLLQLPHPGLVAHYVSLQLAALVGKLGCILLSPGQGAGGLQACQPHTA